MATLTTARLRAIAIFTLTCLLFSVSGAIFVNAHDGTKELESEREVVTLRYQYTGTDAGNVTDENAWQDVTNTNPQSCDNRLELPCVVEFDSSQYDDIEEFLDAHPSLTEIMGATETISTKSAG